MLTQPSAVRHWFADTAFGYRHARKWPTTRACAVSALDISVPAPEARPHCGQQLRLDRQSKRSFPAAVARISPEMHYIT